MFQVEVLNSASTVLRVRGDVDFYSRERLRRALELAAGSGAERLVVSLEDCRFVDCSGIGVLVALRNALGSRLKLVIPKKHHVYRVFEILRLVEPFEVVATLDEALLPHAVHA